jgi:hypothetical protein
MQMTFRPSNASSGAARGLALTAMAVGLACGPAAAQEETDNASTLGVELNKLEQTGTACRSYMVLSNRTDATLDQLSLDLVVFDTDGVIDRRLAVELGPVQAGRTRVKVFDMADLDCGRVARVLLNDVLTCIPERVDEATTCDAALRLSGRGDVDFIR